MSEKLYANTPCFFFNSPGGCWFGDNCYYSHTKDKPAQCRFYRSASGCRYGDCCMYSHDLLSDSLDSPTASPWPGTASYHFYTQQVPGVTTMDPWWGRADTFSMGSSSGVFSEPIEEQNRTGTPSLLSPIDIPTPEKNDIAKALEGLELTSTPHKAQRVSSDTDDEEYKDALDSLHEEDVDNARSVTHSRKRKITKLKCSWCRETVSGRDMRRALSDHYRQQLLKLHTDHLHFFRKHDQFNVYSISCRICSRTFDCIADFLDHTKSEMESDKKLDDHTKVLDTLLVPFVENNLGELDDLDMRSRLMLLLLSCYDYEDDTSSDLLHRMNKVNSMRGETLEKEMERREVNFDKLFLPYAGICPDRDGFGCDSDSDYEDEIVEELLCQGIKPWDLEARAAVAVLYDGIDF